MAFSILNPGEFFTTPAPEGGYTGRNRPWDQAALGAGFDLRGLNEEVLINRILMTLMLPSTFQAIQRANMAQPALDRASRALQPGNEQQLMEQNTNRIRSQGQDAGNRQAADLLSQGFSESAAQGARNAAGNAAQTGVNQMLLDFNSPEQIAERAMAQMQLAQAPFLGNALSASGGRTWQSPPKGPSFLQQIAGLAGTIAGGGINLGNLFGGSGGNMLNAGLNSAIGGISGGASGAGMPMFGGGSFGYIPNPLAFMGGG